MTQEQKAKAYDEAIKKANEYLSSPRTCFDIEQLYDIFPELKESEDERIRQKLLFLCYAWRNNEQVKIPSKKEVEKTIAWLEKQGDKPTAWSKEDEIAEFAVACANALVK